MGLSATDTIGRLPLDEHNRPLEATRGWTQFGLRSRVLGRYTFQITGGSAGAGNTYSITANGVALCTPVASTATPNTDAASLATAINANAASNGFVATVATDTVTIIQRKSGAVTIAKVVAGDATATLATGAASTDTWSEFVSGATFDGSEYYELSWSGALVVDAAQSITLSGAMPCYLKLYCDGQAFRLWSGGLRTASNAIVQGIPVATVTWSDRLPWPNGYLPMIIKVAANEELLYIVEYV